MRPQEHERGDAHVGSRRRSKSELEQQGAVGGVFYDLAYEAADQLFWAPCAIHRRMVSRVVSCAPPAGMASPHVCVGSHVSVEQVTSLVVGVAGKAPSSLYIMKLFAGSPALMMSMLGLPTIVVPSARETWVTAGWPTVWAMIAASCAVVGPPVPPLGTPRNGLYVELVQVGFTDVSHVWHATESAQEFLKMGATSVLKLTGAPASNVA
jgi:hypothetical protein